MDPITLSFLIGGGLMTGGGMALGAWGPKGKYEQTGGLSMEAIRSLGDEQRTIGLKAIRDEQDRYMGQASAGASMQGLGRSGLRSRAFPGVAERGSDARARLLASLAQQQAGLMASRQFSYVPSRSEQIAKGMMGMGPSFLQAGLTANAYQSRMPGQGGQAGQAGMDASGWPTSERSYETGRSPWDINPPGAWAQPDEWTRRG